MALAYYDDDGEKAAKIFTNGVGKLFALALLAIAFLIFSMLRTYSMDDPSPMNLTQTPATNALGTVGAYIADPMIRMLGRAVWVLPLVLAIWGLRRYFNVGHGNFMNRILFVPLAMLVASVFFATHSVSANWPFDGIGMGGIIGDQLLTLLITVTPLPNSLALIVLTLLLTVASFAAVAFVSGIHRYEIASYGAKLWDDFRHALAGAIEFFGRLRNKMPAQSQATEATANLGSSVRAKLGAGLGSAAGVSQNLFARVGSKSRGTTAQDRTRSLKISDVFNGKTEPTLPERTNDPDQLVDYDPKFQSDNPTVRAVVARRIAEHHQRLKSGDASHAQNNEGASAPSNALTAADPLSAREPLVQSNAPRKGTLSARARSEAEPKFAFDPNADQPSFEKPSLMLLQNPDTISRHIPPREALEASAKQLQDVLDDYGIKGEIVAVRPGPVVTMYELEPAAGVKASRVIGLADDIARSMSALTARVATVPGRSVIGIELPNDKREMVLLREIFAKKPYGDSKLPLPLALGKDIAGDPIVANLAKMPHLLIAGTTGSGKSVAINTMILSLLYHASPEDVRLIMIDPKMLELSVYDGIPHLLSPVVTDPKKAVVALKWTVAEMEERYRKMSKMGVRNIDGYNSRVKEALAKGEGFSRTVQTGFDDATGEPIFETEEYAPETMPYIVVIVDEMADLMLVAGKEIEACIQRLAQMARASGIHIIMATQRPSVDVITGTIKANFPTRISFQVTSKIDSRTILGEMGAEQLLGQGDMLFMEGGGRVQRVHGPFVSDEEVEEVVRHLKSQGEPVYESGVLEGPEEGDSQAIDAILGLGSGNGDADDQLYDQAVMIVARDRKASTSYIQRKLSIGYNKAAKLVERMEEEGVISEANHVGKRDVLVPEIS